MANTIATQVIVDGSRNTIIKVTIDGDGSSDLSNQIVFDASSYDGANTSNKLISVQYAFDGFSAELLWAADVNVPIVSMPSDYQDEIDFCSIGGLPNNASTGKTGDILISTSGMVGKDTSGYMVIYVKKK